MHAIRRSFHLLVLAAVLSTEACSENGGAAAPSVGGPTATEVSEPAPETPAASSNRMYGNASRIVGSKDVGSRVTPPGAPPAASPFEGDWSFNLGASVNSAVALTGSFTGANCSDRLFAGANTTAGPNLYAFDNLHAKGAGGVACTNVVDARCNASPAPASHCPHLLWSKSLLGALDGNAVTPSLDGSVIYVATTFGALYAIDAATGATHWVLDVRGSFRIADATFKGVTPWVDYGTGDIFVAGWSPASGTGAIGKISSTGTVKTFILLPAGIVSTPILYNGFVYMAALDGKIYKVADGATLTMVNGAWPVTLQNNQGIISSPTVDTVNDRLFVGLNDNLYSVSLTTGATATTSIGSSGATAPCGSSPFVDLATLSVFVGHKGSIWRAPYTTSGGWTGANRSASVKSNDASTVVDPTSSPLVFAPIPGQTFAYIGDFGGFLNRWSASTLAAPLSSFPSGATGVGGRIESPVMVDYMNGNLYFGASTGRIYQIGQVTLL
jgi:hypothetical protein